MTGLWAYLWFILLMIGCSIGLPYPEEAVLLGAGYLAGKEGNGVDLVPAILVCGFGVLLGDTVVYSLGRFVGPPVLQRWPFKKHFTPRRIRKSRLAFVKHGAKLLLPIRVVPVARAVAHFTAGMLSYSYWKFLLWDAIGVAIVVPVSVWLAYRYGEAVAKAVEEGNFWIGVLAGAGIAGWAIWYALFRKKTTANPVLEAPTVLLDTRPKAAPPVPPEGNTPLPGQAPAPKPPSEAI